MNSISKNVYIDKLDDIVTKYNNIYHSTIRRNLLMQNQILILGLLKKSMKNILNLKLVILLECQNIKTFLPKFSLQIGLNKFVCLKNLEICVVSRTYVLSHLNGEEIVGTFCEKKLQKKIKKVSELKK